MLHETLWLSVALVTKRHLDIGRKARQGNGAHPRADRRRRDRWLIDDDLLVCGGCLFGGVGLFWDGF
ncbi:MAG: hypothetical protein ACPHP5_05435 [Candidatus Puniceispirillaceae bacterium]